MKLLTLHAENLFSLSNVNLSLDNKGPVLITGHSLDENKSNGAGKSSIGSKAIVWCLFGQTVGGLRNDDVINRHTTGTALARIEFIGNDEQRYVIERTRKPNNLKLTQNGLDISRKLEKDTQELIEQALGRTFDTFIQTDFFGQGKLSAYLSLPAKEQKRILEDILPLDKLTKWSETAREMKNDTDKIIAVDQRSKAILEGRLQEIENQKVRLVSSKDLWEKNNLNKLDELNKKLIKEKEKYKLNIEKKQSINEYLEKAQSEESIQQYIILLHQQSVDFQEQLQTLVSTGIQTWEASKLSWDRYITNLNKILDSHSSECPTCGSDIDTEHIQYEINNSELKRKECIKNIKAGNNEIEKTRGHLNVVTNSLKDHMENLESLRELKRELEYLNITMAPVAAIEDQIEQTKQEANPYTEQLNSFSSDTSAIEAQVRDIDENIAILSNKISHITAWINIFGKNFYAYVLNRACPYLEQRTTTHLEGLRNSQFKVKFQTIKELKSGDQRDEFNISVISDTGGSSFEALSGGEQQLVSFAVGMALADLAETQVEGKSNVLILDEPFVELDYKNQEAVVDYINSDLRKNRDTILIISNDEHLKSLIPSRVNVIKENGISNVREEL
jgi:DNA repair exonuclease SbcCD ATPase subunit